MVRRLPTDIIVGYARMLWEFTEPPRRVMTWVCIALIAIFISDQVFQLFVAPYSNNIKWWQALGSILIMLIFIMLLNLGRRTKRDAAG